MNDYSRTREVDGQEIKDYWDGYEWRQAAEVTTGEDGSTVVTFAPEEGKPTSIERDASSDELKVTFASGLTYDARWRDQNMTRTDAEGASVQLFNSGVNDSEGKPIWKEGTIVREEESGYVVQFASDAETAAAEGAETYQGESPAGVVIQRGTEDAPPVVQALYAEQSEETDPAATTDEPAADADQQAADQAAAEQAAAEQAAAEQAAAEQAAAERAAAEAEAERAAAEQAALERAFAAAAALEAAQEAA
jgi:hypothetical protein